MDSDEDLVAGRAGSVDVDDLDYLRRAVSVANRCLHESRSISGARPIRGAMPAADQDGEPVYGFAGNRLTQYSVVGIPNRAFTTHKEPAWNAAVVGTLKSVEGRLPTNFAIRTPARA